jgi:flavin reductase (DIM6/NTAB) family NADH-FMN oxidoreductase RutF
VVEVSLRSIDLSGIGVREIYRLMTGLVIPRPIAWVSSISSDGRGNLAPFSYFNMVASKPPTLMVAISHKKEGSLKDTARNIEAVGEFVVNLVGFENAQAMHETSAEMDYGVNELERVGLTAVNSSVVRPVRVAESPAQLECRLVQKTQIGPGGAGSTTVYFGEIVALHVREGLVDSEYWVDARALNPVARLGQSYAQLGAEWEPKG